MKQTTIDLRKMLLYCLVALMSGVAFACDDDDDDIDDILDNEESFENVQLRGENEVPAVTTTGSGVMNATYDRETRVITYTLNWTLGDVNRTTTAMHFHGPASPTETAPPVIPVTGFSTSYTGSLSGTTRPLTEAEENDLLDGRWYFNIHSDAFPNGELRGNLLD